MQLLFKQVTEHDVNEVIVHVMSKKTSEEVQFSPEEVFRIQFELKLFE